MSDALLTLLKWCLLALVYLFFFRVLQVTWAGSTTNVAVRRVANSKSGNKSLVGAGSSSDRSTPPAAPLGLVIVEPPHDRRQFAVAGEMTIGRAQGCQIALDDTYISQLHARVSTTDQGIVIEDLGSTNGTYVNRQRVTTPVYGDAGDQIQVGGIVMELRPIEEWHR